MDKSRAARPQLTDVDAARVKGMLRRKDVQSDIAQYHSCNQGRIVEIRQGKRFKNVQPMPLDQLPPPGPYAVVSRSSHERGEIAERLVRDLRHELSLIVSKLYGALDQYRGEQGVDGEGNSVSNAHA